MAQKLPSPLIILVVALITSFLSCGGNSSAPITPPPVAVSLSPNASILQTGSTLQLTAQVANASNPSVSWEVDGVSGGNTTVGTISASGLFSAPVSIAETAEHRVTAISVSDTSKSASVTVTVFAAPVIGVRVVSQAGEFYDKSTLTRFIPRGNNYIRLLDHLIVPPVNQSLPFQAVFAPSLYNATKIETALAEMETSGYNWVRVLLDPYGATDGIGNPSGSGVSTAYVTNLADFLKRAKAHHLFVTIATDDLPRVGGYQDTIDSRCLSTWPGCWNLEYTTSAGVTAERKFWQDLIRTLVQQHAPMNAVFSYQLREEFYYPGALGPGDSEPLLPTSGTFTAANGKTYDMSDPSAREQLKDESLVYWTDRTREAIQQLAPGAVVGVGFIAATHPWVPKFSVAASSTADYIDGHIGPYNVVADMTGWGKPAGPSAKPVTIGEFAAPTTDFPLETDAAAALKALQVQTCNEFGINGWALWSWDTAEHDTLGFPHWYALRGTGLVNHELAPANRFDPCQN